MANGKRQVAEHINTELHGARAAFTIKQESQETGNECRAASKHRRAGIDICIAIVAPTKFGFLEQRTGSFEGGLHMLALTSVVAAMVVFFAQTGRSGKQGQRS